MMRRRHYHQQQQVISLFVRVQEFLYQRNVAKFSLISSSSSSLCSSPIVPITSRCFVTTKPPPGITAASSFSTIPITITSSTHRTIITTTTCLSSFFVDGVFCCKNRSNSRNINNNIHQLLSQQQPVLVSFKGTTTTTTNKKVKSNFRYLTTTTSTINSSRYRQQQQPFNHPFFNRDHQKQQPQSQSFVRTFMDVHTRPSHSGMFPPTTTKKQTPKDEEDNEKQNDCNNNKTTMTEIIDQSTTTITAAQHNRQQQSHDDKSQNSHHHTNHTGGSSGSGSGSKDDNGSKDDDDDKNHQRSDGDQSYDQHTYYDYESYSWSSFLYSLQSIPTRTIIFRIFSWMGIIHVITEYIGDITLCEGPSMYPTIYPNGDIIYIDKYFVRHSIISLISNNKYYDDSWIASQRKQYAQQRQVEYRKATTTADSTGGGSSSTSTDNENENDEDIERWYQPYISVSDYWSLWYHSPPLPSSSSVVVVPCTSTSPSSSTTTFEQKQQQPYYDSYYYRWYEKVSIILKQFLCTPLQVGDVVVVDHPYRYGTVCKRIVGLPGDEIMILEPTITPLSSQKNNTTRMMKRKQKQKKIVLVPDGHVWLEGDNPENSSDSRNSYGCIPCSLIIGRAVLRIWPLYRPNSNQQQQQQQKEDPSSFSSASSSNVIPNDVLWFLRGTRPCEYHIHPEKNRTTPTSIVLPAGYEGQEIQTTITTTNQHQ